MPGTARGSPSGPLSPRASRCSRVIGSPNLPGELGFYDLRVPETRYLQARLAREHGITRVLVLPLLVQRPAHVGPAFPGGAGVGTTRFSVRAVLGERELVPQMAGDDRRDAPGAGLQRRGRPRAHPVAHRGLQGPPVHPGERTTAPGRLSRRTTSRTRSGPWSCGAASARRPVSPHPWLVMFETSEDVREPGELGFDASAEFVPHLLSSFLKPQTFGDGTHR